MNLKKKSSPWFCVKSILLVPLLILMKHQVNCALNKSLSDSQVQGSRETLV